MAQKGKSGKKRVGVTHFRLEKERRTQEAVPPRGHAKKKGPRILPAPRKRVKSVEEVTMEQVGAAGPGRRITDKSGKGGRTGGTRAALLSRGQNDRGRKARKTHPLDLL